MKDKVVLITGGSSGIGKATALLFAREGAIVFISYKENKVGADKTVLEIQALGAKGYAFQANLSLEEEAKKLVTAVFEKASRIDILVNNAGRYISSDEWNGTSKIWSDSLNQSLISVLSTSKFAAEIMQRQRSWVIVNVASRYSVMGQSDAIAYAAAKAGVANITQAYAKLLAPWGRANAVSPGVVRAGYWKKASDDEINQNISDTLLKKVIEPEDIAETILFLSSDKSQMITGQNIIVDAGYMIK